MKVVDPIKFIVMADNCGYGDALGKDLNSHRKETARHVLYQP